MNELIRYDLLSDERILWSGQPNSNKLFNKNDFFMVPFSLMWGGFAIFWETTVVMSGAPVFFSLWGIPFVLIGLYIIFGRFFVKAYIRRNTHYYLTNKRVIVLKNTRNRNIQAEYIDTVPCINKEVYGENQGTIVFGNSYGVSAMYADSGMDYFIRGNRYGVMAPAFYDIEGVEDVYKKVSEIRNGTFY